MGVKQEVVSMSKTEIQLRFNFDKPLEVSPMDTLRIAMNFNAFEPGIDSSFVMEEPCSRQVPEGGATEAVQTLSNVSSAATAGAVIGSALMQIVMAGCLAQVWGMINGLQIMVHLPALNVNFPGNAWLVVEKVLVVATFDLPVVNMDLFGPAFPLPSDDNIL